MDLSPLQLTAGRPILCIDDGATQLMLLTRYLSRAGYSSIVTATGIEGLEVLKHQTPALVLLDLQMPEMDGFSFLAHAALTDPMQNYPIPLGADAMEMLLKQSNINQEAVNREVNAVVREAETLAMCNFESDQIPPRLITKPIHSVAVRPDRMPASPLNVFLDKAANRVICFRTVNEVAKEQWSAINIDGAVGGMRFADRSMRDFSKRKDLQGFPTFCLATADLIDTLRGAYDDLPVKLITAPCWARELLPG